MINPNLEQGHHWYYWVYLMNKSTFVAFSTVPRKANFAELHCIGLIGNCANLPLDYEEVLTKSGERWWQGSMSSPETQSRCHSQKSWQELHLSLSKAMLCCSLEGSKAWTLGCYGFPRAQIPSLTCLGFSEKKPQTHRTLVSAWIGATASNKKAQTRKARNKKSNFWSFGARGGQILVLFSTFGRDSVWFIAKTFILHRSVGVPPPAPQPLFLLASSIFSICISPWSPQEEPQYHSSRQNLRSPKSFCSFTLYTQLSFQLLARKYFFF